MIAQPIGARKMARVTPGNNASIPAGSARVKAPRGTGQASAEGRTDGGTMPWSVEARTMGATGERESEGSDRSDGSDGVRPMRTME
jgi:hypothetical protein